MTVTNSTYNLPCYTTFHNQKLDNLDYNCTSRNRLYVNNTKNNTYKQIKQTGKLALFSSIISGLAAAAIATMDGAKGKALLLKSAGCAAISAAGVSLIVGTVLLFKNKQYFKTPSEVQKDDRAHCIVLVPLAAILAACLKGFGKVLNR